MWYDQRCEQLGQQLCLYQRGSLVSIHNRASSPLNHFASSPLTAVRRTKAAVASIVGRRDRVVANVHFDRSDDEPD